MTEQRSASGSAAGRGQRAGSGVWAAGCAVLWLCACSGATDVVGVVDPPVTDVQRTSADSAGSSTGRGLGSGPAAGPAAGPASSDGLNPTDFSGSSPSGADGSELLVVAGLPLHDYPGPTFRWPLNLRLRNFFSEPSWGRSGPPDHVEREAFERMGSFFSEQHKEDVRFVASTGTAALLLRELFNDAREFFGVEQRSVVTRDGWSDDYLVVLGKTVCDRSVSHHGDPCADLGSFAGSSSDPGNSDPGNSDAANANEADGASFGAP